MMTARQIVDTTNDLARTFYAMHGCVVKDGYKFYNARHPKEILCWKMAAEAMEHIGHTEIEDALEEIREKENGR